MKRTVSAERDYYYKKIYSRRSLISNFVLSTVKNGSSGLESFGGEGTHISDGRRIRLTPR